MHLGTRTGRFPWAAAVLLALVAAISREGALIVLAAGVAVAGAVVETTARLALLAVEVRAEARPARVVAGETFTVTFVVANRKALPLPWLEVRLDLPEGIEPAADQQGRARSSIGAGFGPRPFERVTLRFTLRAAQRGAYALGPVRIGASDWLGFIHDDRTLSPGLTLVAYPAPLAVRDRHLASLRPLAETATRRGLLPDPLRFRGVREHRTGDARKEIHWKASARLRQLQTKLYEPATSLDAVFLVNVASYDQYWIQADPDATELVVSAAAELLRLAAEAGRQVGLITNGLDNITHERPRSALGRGPRPLTRSLDILARLGPYAAAAPETVFLRERGRIAWGASLIVVTPRLGAALAQACVALRRAHHRVMVVTVQVPPDEIARQVRSNGVAIDVLARPEARRAS
ncbi:MAG: DUF58 domain-containing protein [Chloroflexota bacterium]|nr:DUF58 domain-containing protein [Chloroflexota bacterium]